jgi:hypothetical protein
MPKVRWSSQEGIHSAARKRGATALSSTHEDDMARRINKPSHDDATRARIQTSQLVNRLNKIAKGEADCTPTQLRAAEILLKKSLPDLASVEHTGEGGGPMKMVIEWQTDQSGS